MDSYLNRNDPVVVTDALTGEPLDAIFLRFDSKTGRMIVKLADTGKVIPALSSDVTKYRPPTT